MNVLKQHPATTTERRSDASDHTESLAFQIWKSLERRLSELTALERRPVVIRPRSQEDDTHFEVMWQANGRDVYRFSVW